MQQLQLVFALLLLLAANLEAQNEGKASFQRMGDGNCMTVHMMPLRGLSRMDLTHGQCRALCNTAVCLGYTYSPCERVCSLHGEPETFPPLPEPDSWGVMNGGGLIAQTDNACGSACFVRKANCDGGTMESAGAFLDYPSLQFGAKRTLDCPFPHKGAVQVACTPVGIVVESGRCLRPCESGLVRDDLFEVQYPPTLHGEYGVGRCPPGTLGNMTIMCSDGEATHELGRCGTNCPSGSLKSGSASVQYTSLKHEEQTSLKCPRGWVGSVQVECVNAIVFAIDGYCNRHCDEGQVNTTSSGFDAPTVVGWASHGELLHDNDVDGPCNSTSDMLTGSLVLRCDDGNVSADYSQGFCMRHCFPGTIGEGLRTVSHDIIPHGGNITVPCNPGFDGFFVLTCDDGLVIHSGGFCYMNCVAGTITSNAVTLPHGFITHGDNVTVECPRATHTGNITVECDDGYAKMVEGYCGLNCTGGAIPSNGALLVHPSLQHLEIKNFSCPLPHGSALEVRCYDGSIRYQGRCGRHCVGGSVTQNGAIVVYPDLGHGEVRSFPCGTLFAGALSFTGSLTVSCFDSAVTALGACFPDCSPAVIRNNGAKISTPFIPSDKFTTLTCEPRPAFGTVEVQCKEGFAVVVEGTCGLPCQPGYFSSVLTRYTDVWIEEVWHDTGVWKDCPEDLSGQIYVHCYDGILRVKEGQCGERCPSESLIVYGASFVSPSMDHLEVFQQPCLPPYSSVVNLNCTFGKLKVDSDCQKGCFAGTTVLPGGATVPFPDLQSGKTSEPECPEGYVGKITLECVDGSIEVQEGACNSHCDADRFIGPSGWMVEYLPILHNDTQWQRCPIGFVGNVQLRCDAGVVSIAQGACPRNCLAGSKFVRDGVTMKHKALAHGEMTNDMRCPNAYEGMIRMQCDDSHVSVVSGECLKHCGPGTIQGAQYRNLLHDTEVSVVCPEVGSISIRCWDGGTTILSGACLYGCKKDQIPDVHGVPIAFSNFPHGTKVNGTCTDLGVGEVELACNDTVVSIIGTGVAARCQRHCPVQTTLSRDGTNVTTPYIPHLQQDAVECPGGAGILSLRCTDSVVTVFDGVCGDENCKAGTVMSNAAVLEHPIINDGRKDGPGDCGDDFIGRPTFICRNGTTAVLDVSIIRQPLIPGIDNESHIGPEYDFEDIDRFLLCGCCKGVDKPDVAPVLGTDTMPIVYWAAAVGGAGLLIALGSGLWIHKMRTPKPKLSQVAPKPEDVAKGAPISPQPIEDNPKLAIGDTEAEKARLALKDATQPDGNNALAIQDARQPAGQDTALALQEFMQQGRAPSTANTERPMRSAGNTNSARNTRTQNPQILKPVRDGSSQKWQYW
eukprot:TRINITY_DN91243_c0_g1_i1.p1 TRINITY_DN91243_c0_g1~~TRINITY_DN91243_c0_g1_i1.p1  ORF type:complete len:1344 (+),score=210.68 TRINITY_DN91243_c0_g1_i1:99-4130(+)